MTASAVLQRCGGTMCPAGTCDHDGTLQRHATGPLPVSATAPPAVQQVLASPGQPLDPAVRADLEPRLGHNFADVRVHTDQAAATSAAAVNAQAYTVGSHMAFATGAYQPASGTGRWLIAHELAHVVQQSGTPATPGGSVLRRACPPTPTNIAATPLTPFPCAFGTPEVVAGSVVTFCQDSTELTDGQTSWVNDIVDEARFATAIEIHGNASVEGPSAQYNATLSCMRAVAVRDLLTTRGITAPITLVAHGPTATYGPAPANRNVVVRPTLRRCGPDATDWFIRQVAAAKADPAVLEVRRKLTEATRLAAMFGLSARLIAEGAVLQKVLEQEAAAGRPPRTPDAVTQILLAAPGGAEFDRAEKLAVALGLAEVVGAPTGFPNVAYLVRALVLIRSAALEWAGLVGTKKRFDFKWDTATMRQPTSPHCPDTCSNTITLCPTTRSDCYHTDVPGNIFYAHVGGFVGWSELILQLGSEWAQLQSTRTWDPPEDTRLIRASFALPDPLTRGGLCATLAANRSIFSLEPCLNCAELTTAVIR